MQEAEFSRHYRYPKLTENPMGDITHGNSKAYGTSQWVTSLSERLLAEWVGCVTQSRHEVEARVRSNADVLLRRPLAAATSRASSRRPAAGGLAGGRLSRRPPVAGWRQCWCRRPTAPPACRESCCRGSFWQ